MGRFSVKNETDCFLRIMIEPLAECYDIPPGELAVMNFDSDYDAGIFELNVFNENFISFAIFTKVDFFINGVKMTPLKEI